MKIKHSKIYFELTGPLKQTKKQKFQQTYRGIFISYSNTMFLAKL